MKVLVIAGPNGAGKTTFSRRYLQFAGSEIPFVNGDEIAARLSPESPEAAAQRAGRIALETMESYATQQRDFAFETTLSGRSYARRLIGWREHGYRVGMVYLRLPSAHHVVKRVARRVREGGHDIPEPVARRRFERSWRNFVELYRPIADEWLVYDTSTRAPTLVASTGRDAVTKDATQAPDRFPEGEPSIKNVTRALMQARDDALARAEAVRRRQAEAAQAEKVSTATET